MATDGGLGPAKDTAVGEIVVITLTATDAHGLVMQPDRDGCCAVIKAMERLPNGKFGIIQRNGGVHVNDVLYAINDTLLENMPHNDVMLMLNDRNILRKSVKFISSTEYYNRKKKHAPSSAKAESRSGFISKVKRARVSENGSGKFSEYEVACQWRLVGSDRIEKDKVIQWSVWKRFSEFESLHAVLKKSLGWQIDGVAFPPGYNMTLNKYSLEFIERRREELNTWWQAIIGVGKVTEFDKHHCSAEIKSFLDVDNATMLDTSSSNSSALVVTDKGTEEDSGAGGNGTARAPLTRRQSAKPAAARRLSSRPDVANNAFAEEATSSSVTAPPKARPNSSAAAPTPPSSSTNTAKSSTTTSSPAPPPAAASPPPSNMSATMTENLGKYNKMKSMLPEGAVRQRMGADGCTDAEIDNFFGVSAAPAPVAAAAPAKPAAAAPAPSSVAAAPPAKPVALPPKTAARANLLSSITARRIE